jgi:hypothetical protein
MKNLIFMLFLGSSSMAYAQTKPVHFSIVHGLSTHGRESKNTDFHFSLNLTSATVGSIRGAEIGGLSNHNNGDMIGVGVSFLK